MSTESVSRYKDKYRYVFTFISPIWHIQSFVRAQEAGRRHLVEYCNTIGRLLFTMMPVLPQSLILSWIGLSETMVLTGPSFRNGSQVHLD